MNTDIRPDRINVVKDENLYKLILMEENGASVTAILFLYQVEKLTAKIKEVTKVG